MINTSFVKFKEATERNGEVMSDFDNRTRVNFKKLHHVLENDDKSENARTTSK